MTDPSPSEALDKKLWQAVIRDVKRLKTEDRVVLRKKTVLHPYRKPYAKRQNPAQEIAGVYLDRDEAKRLKKRRDPNKVYLDGKIDLHGLVVEEAYHTMRVFIHKMVAKHARWVLVVTGKSGTLYNEVPKWLELMTESVKFFQHAREVHGGKGALYIALKSEKLPKPNKQSGEKKNPTTRSSKQAQA